MLMSSCGAASSAGAEQPAASSDTAATAPIDASARTERFMISPWFWLFARNARTFSQILI
jgi:hypothetical protein